MWIKGIKSHRVEQRSMLTAMHVHRSFQDNGRGGKHAARHQLTQHEIARQYHHGVVGFTGQEAGTKADTFLALGFARHQAAGHVQQPIE